MADLKTLKNTVGTPQSIVYQGQQFVLRPFAEETFDADVAEKFLEICAPAVKDTTEEFGATFAPDREETTAWVANMTGNPDAPDHVKERRATANRRWEEVDIINPNKAPRSIHREELGGHRAYTSKDGGLVQESLPAKVWEIPPFRRRPMPANTANWFIERDAATGAGRGAAIMSRPPSEFEPKMDWKLDEMRSYLRLIDPTCDLGVGENELRAQAEREKWDEVVAKEALRQAKQAVMKKLYFRVVNPEFRLPSRKEFYEFITGKSEEQVLNEQLGSILAKSEATVAKAQRTIVAQEK